MPIAIGLLLVVAEMTSPVRGQPSRIEGSAALRKVIEASAAERKEYARKRFEATEAGLKGLGEARLETIREMWGEAAQEFVFGRQQQSAESLMAVIQAWQEAAETHLEPGPARERELAQIGMWLRKVEKIAWAKWEAGSLSTSDLHACRLQRLLFEYDLRKNRPHAGLPSAARGLSDPFLREFVPTSLRAQARARFATSQANPGQREEQLLETARVGLRATFQEFIFGRQQTMLDVLHGRLHLVQQAEQIAAGREVSRRELLEREWQVWLELERISQAKFQSGSLRSADFSLARLYRLQVQTAMAQAGAVQPANQRRRQLLPSLSRDARLEDRSAIQDSFAGTVTPLAVLRQQKLEAAEDTFQAVVQEFVDGKREVSVNWVLRNALLPLQASLELHEDRSATLRMALRSFEMAWIQEKIALAKFESGQLGTSDLLAARFKRITAALHLLQVSQPRPER